MYYVELDGANLSKWFTGALGTSGPNANTPAAIRFISQTAEAIGRTPPSGLGLHQHLCKNRGLWL